MSYTILLASATKRRRTNANPREGGRRGGQGVEGAEGCQMIDDILFELVLPFPLIVQDQAVDPAFLCYSIPPGSVVSDRDSLGLTIKCTARCTDAEIFHHPRWVNVSAKIQVRTRWR